MDPNNPNLQKLEQDLQNLSQGTPVQPVVPQVSGLPIPDQEPVQPPPSQEPKNGSPVVTIAIILGVVSLLAIAAYAIGTIYTGKTAGPVVCTMDAKICPDGSSVGRTGPNCEFEECPTPLESASPSATPTATATPSSTSTPTGTPLVIPAAY